MLKFKRAFHEWLTVNNVSDKKCKQFLVSINNICTEITKEELHFIHQIVEEKYIDIGYILSKYHFFANIKRKSHTIQDNEIVGISWEELATDLPLIILGYDGRKKTILQKYNEFLFESELPDDVLKIRHQNILYMMSQSQIQSSSSEYYLTSDLVQILGINVRVIKRWRAERIRQGNLDPSKFEQLHENPYGEGKIGPKFVVVGGKYRYYFDDLKAYFGRDIGSM